MNDAKSPEEQLMADKKPPRKPRPSEIAAKKARKAAKRTKLKSKKKPPAKRVRKAVKTKRKPGKAGVRHVGGVQRSERLDFRLTKSEKKGILGKAKALKRTITSVVVEGVAKLK